MTVSTNWWEQAVAEATKGKSGERASASAANASGDEYAWPTLGAHVQARKRPTAAKSLWSTTIVRFYDPL